MKKFFITLLVLVLAGGTTAWFKRGDIMLAVIKYKAAAKYEVVENRELPWQQGPAEPVARGGERPPNIILIVADDLGYNDISTFGGGVADGRIKTPGIDHPAAEGAVFTQSYSGASTCAPSRAMMMTGRYPTRTGFEFTPTPAGMGKMVSSISAGMDNNMPPSFYDEALEAGQPPYELKGLPASEVTIAEVLKEKGYYTAHIGKWHLGRDNGMAALESEGLAENTMVVFTSDNGGPGYIGIDDVNSPYRGWKITMFEGGLRVPMFVKWPAKIAPGTIVDKPVAHIDMMPTLAAAAGAAQPEGVAIDGVELLSLASGEGMQSWNRETLFWQSGHYQVVRHGDWKLQVNNRPTDGLKKWLHNLAEDPTEQINLAASRTDKVQELSALLAAHQTNSRGPLYESTVEIPVMIDKSLTEQFVQGDEYIYTPN